MRLHHIDGLRAVAVIAVLLFHVGAQSFSGGFVGVDVFFVISGYVITRQILRHMETGEFTFLRFYERRLNRLYPALIVTVALCLIASFLILPPGLLADFSKSAIATIAAVSNIYFWNSAGYFDTASVLKPLLHTWTLSLEWQFYLIWPLVIWSVPRRVLPHFIITASVASAVLCAIWWFDPATPFYWMPFRIFEFGLGALVLWLPQPRRIVSDAASLSGLALVALAVFTFTDQTPFPSYFALAPALGATLIIWGGGTGIVSAPLRWRATTYLGRISYSTYLAHWPLIVFTVAYTAQDLTPTAAVVICLSSVALGAVLYHCVELPFWHGRFASRAKEVVLITAIPVAALLYLSIDGLWWRLPPPWDAISPDAVDFHRTQYGGVGYASKQVVRIGAPDAPIHFHIMGDSFSLHLLSGLDEELKARGLAADAFGNHGCPMMAGTSRLRNGQEDATCTASISEALTHFNDGLPIVLAISWRNYQSTMLAEGSHAVFETSDHYHDFLLQRIVATKDVTGTSKLIIFGNTPEVQRMRLTPFECATAPVYLADPPACRSFMQAVVRDPLLESRFRSLAATDASIYTIDPTEYLCRGTECSAFNDGNLLYSDGSHLSKAGSAMIAPRLLEDILAEIRILQSRR